MSPPYTTCELRKQWLHPIPHFAHNAVGRCVHAAAIAIVVFFLSPLLACAASIYIAPQGSNVNSGSIDSPLGSFEFAIYLAKPGDSIVVREGTYSLSSRIRVRSSDSGTAEKPISLAAYPGEKPILDFSGMSTSRLGQEEGRGIQFDAGANWWQIEGLTVQNAKDNGIYNGGSNNVFRQTTTRWNADSGFQLGVTAAHNLIHNSDSYENYDPHNRGENADGFAAKNPVGPGNVFRGDRAWGNADDGWDMWDASANGVLIVDSWSYDNGRDPLNDAATFNGDGNGFKLGRDSGSHILDRVLAWNNPHNGIDINANGTNYIDGSPVGLNGSVVQVYNSSAYQNGRNWQFDEDISHILRNNVSYAGETADQFTVAIDDLFNTWQGIPISDSDFTLLSDAIARGARNADGSLPMSDFLRPSSDSGLIDRGTLVDYVFGGVSYNAPFFGVAPDLGAFELVPEPTGMCLAGIGLSAVIAIRVRMRRSSISDRLKRGSNLL